MAQARRQGRDGRAIGGGMWAEMFHGAHLRGRIGAARTFEWIALAILFRESGPACFDKKDMIR